MSIKDSIYLYNQCLYTYKYFNKVNNQLLYNKQLYYKHNPNYYFFTNLGNNLFSSIIIKQRLLISYKLFYLIMFLYNKNIIKYTKLLYNKHSIVLRRQIALLEKSTSDSDRKKYTELTDKYKILKNSYYQVLVSILEMYKEVLKVMNSHYSTYLKKNHDQYKIIYYLYSSYLSIGKYNYTSLFSSLVSSLKERLCYKITFNFYYRNIFFTLSNYKGEVIKYYSIGKIGYKKDKKKTYFAAEQLLNKVKIILRNNVFNFKKISKEILEILFFSKKFNYFWVILKKLGYGSSQISMIKKKFKEKLHELIKTSISVWLILKGSKSRMRGIINKLFKELKSIKYSDLKSFETYPSKLYFIAVNNKPHNGCTPPKKGRKKIRRRKKRFKLALKHNRPINIKKSKFNYSSHNMDKLLDYYMFKRPFINKKYQTSKQISHLSNIIKYKYNTKVNLTSSMRKEHKTKSTSLNKNLKKAYKTLKFIKAN